MGQAFVPGLMARAGVTLQRVRELPAPGQVLKNIGDQVAAHEIVAQADLPGDLIILRVAEKLGIEPFEAVRGLLVKQGDQITEGQILCDHAGLFGLFRSRFTSPSAGTIDFITSETGHVGLRLKPRPITIDAYLSGKVVAVRAGKSITIESQAAFVQGIFGVGGERQGRLQLLHVAADKELTESDITENCRDAVLVGGTLPSLAAIKRAAALGATALIVGSIDDQALAGYLGYDLGVAITGDEDIPMTVIITEGFGKLPMSARVLQVLQPLDGLPVSVNGATQVRAGAVRPEIIVHTSQAKYISSPPSIEPSLELQVGSRIRAIRVPYFGQFGAVIALPHALEKIETGAETRVLRALLDDNREVTIPRANVELA